MISNWIGTNLRRGPEVLLPYSVWLARHFETLEVSVSTTGSCDALFHVWSLLLLPFVVVTEFAETNVANPGEEPTPPPTWLRCAIAQFVHILGVVNPRLRSVCLEDSLLMKLWNTFAGSSLPITTEFVHMNNVVLSRRFTHCFVRRNAVVCRCLNEVKLSLQALQYEHKQALSEDFFPCDPDPDHWVFPWGNTCHMFSSTAETGANPEPHPEPQSQPLEFHIEGSPCLTVGELFQNVVHVLGGSLSDAALAAGQECAWWSLPYNASVPVKDMADWFIKFNSTHLTNALHVALRHQHGQYMPRRGCAFGDRLMWIILISKPFHYIIRNDVLAKKARVGMLNIIVTLRDLEGRGMCPVKSSVWGGRTMSDVVRTLYKCCVLKEAGKIGLDPDTFVIHRDTEDEEIRVFDHLLARPVEGDCEDCVNDEDGDVSGSLCGSDYDFDMDAVLARINEYYAGAGDRDVETDADADAVLVNVYTRPCKKTVVATEEKVTTVTSTTNTPDSGSGTGTTISVVHKTKTKTVTTNTVVTTTVFE
jgi:hypothetical protein